MVEEDQAPEAPAVGVRQAATVNAWELGRSRPIQPYFERYLSAIGWDEPLAYGLLASKIDEQLQRDDASANARWD